VRAHGEYHHAIWTATACNKEFSLFSTMCQCVVYYWYSGSAWPLQTSLGSLVRFGQM